MTRRNNIVAKNFYAKGHFIGVMANPPRSKFEKKKKIQMNLRSRRTCVMEIFELEIDVRT